MAMRMIAMVIITGLVFGAIFGFIDFRNHMIAKFMAARGFPPQTVAALQAGYQEWQPQLKAVGDLRAVNGADLSSEVSGVVSALHFESGADVKAGAPLVELASADDVAKLESLKATAALARITLDRDRRQLEVRGVSQQTIDTDTQNLKNADAQVAEQQATVDYKFIRAPFDGRLGIRQVDLGQYLAAGTTMVTLQSLDPIFVDFYLPQQDLDQIRIGQRIDCDIDTYPGRSFTGRISAINAKIDNATRNIQIRATLANPDDSLLPGMYATVEVEVGSKQSVITLPQTAIAYNSYGSTVFLVEDGGRDATGHPTGVARSAFVTTGEARGDQVQVLTGVKQGDTVVVAGQIKLRDGTPVIIDNSLMPKFEPNPLPADQ